MSDSGPVCGPPADPSASLLRPVLGSLCRPCAVTHLWGTVLQFWKECVLPPGLPSPTSYPQRSVGVLLRQRSRGTGVRPGTAATQAASHGSGPGRPGGRGPVCVPRRRA